MFRVKNESEWRESEEDECCIAHCHNKSEKLYNNEINIVDVCLDHYNWLTLQRYGE